MRNKDNFQNSKQYIINQLFILNYNNEDDFNHLKMKLWVLDGPIRQEELIGGETPDKDVNNPMNHWATLVNDLKYLDIYYRTQKGLLEDNEDNFDIFWNKRLNQKQKFVSKINPDTGNLYEDWEQSYLARPSLLSKSDFNDLYVAFNSKVSNGELVNVNDIIHKITTYSIDHESLQAERAVLNHIPAEEMEAGLVIKAEENKEKNDNNYVKEMIELHTELFSFINYLMEEHGSSEEYLINVPTERVYVSTTEEVSGSETEETSGSWTPSISGHRGPVIEMGDLQSGGYRFVYKNIEGVALDTEPSLSISEDLDLTGELERGWESLIIASSSSTDETKLDISLLTSEEDDEELEDTAFLYDSKTIERFNELNNRWKTINKLREEQIANTGTRTIIESMATADIPELYEDKVNHFNTRKDQKLYYTNILKERRDEFN